MKPTFAYDPAASAVINFLNYCEGKNLSFADYDHFTGALDAFIKEPSTARNRPENDIIRWDDVQACIPIPDDDSRWAKVANEE